MHDEFISSLEWQYSSYSTPELLVIWKDRHRRDSNYIEETFEAVRRILSEREVLPPEAGVSDANPGTRETPDSEHVQSFSFCCVFCSEMLRFMLPMTTDVQICPGCDAVYDPVHVQGQPELIILVPKPRAEATHESSASREGSAVTSEVETALATLGLTVFASFDEAKQAYRNGVRQYHPDRVAHLGPELQHLAEAKTKELISAYDKIRRFFGDPRR